MHGLLFLPLFLVLPAAKPVGRIDYNRDVKPILARNCFACHGPDETHREAGLRLDDRESATAGRKAGPAIDAKVPAASRLLARLADADDPMPPAETGNRPTAEQVAVLKRWIEQGAEYAPHWAFVKPTRPAVPPLKWADGSHHPIDAFLLRTMAAKGLEPSPPAEKPNLLRRLSLDLRGLPPTPDEVKEFVADTSPDAYAKWVDRFLADPAYGERLARPWLDLARFADSAGHGSDPLRPDMHPYRDWVIAAFNANQPYDRFTVEQVAGDLLPNPTTAQRAATAFNRNTMTNTEGGVDREEFRVFAVKDRADTTMQVWMGLTFGCAKCHTHKYDPITQVEYYRAYAIFNQTEDRNLNTEAPRIPVASAEQVARARELDVRIAALRAEMAKDTPERRAAREVWDRANPKMDGEADAKREVRFFEESPYFHKAATEISVLEIQKPKVPELPVMVELAENKRRPSHLHIKGDFLNPGEAVAPGLPAAFPRPTSDRPIDRLALADWLVSPENPLTARVEVNRLWAMLYGRGLVETEEDFGTQGEWPTDPELLDWLATEFVRLKWDIKAFLKMVVLSASYRQSSAATADHLRIDPRNLYLARAPRYRLEAETVRDQALSLAGLLSGKIGGPSVYPPQPDGLWQAAFNGQRSYPTSKGDEAHRRGLYTVWRRTVPYPSMAAFDAPSRETCAVRRIRTNTPLQAFVTLNDPVYVEAARAMGGRILADGGEDDGSRLKFGYALATARPAGAEAVKNLQILLDAQRAKYAADAPAAKKLAGGPEAAAWTVVANVLLNLDAVLTRN